jgi:hypothetical protein
MENNDEQNLEVKTACEPEITIPVNGTPADAKDDVDDR